MVIRATHNNSQRQFATNDAFGTTITAFTQNDGQTWPFVTIPDFNIQGKSFRSLIASRNVLLLPVVTNRTKSDWEAYAVNNQGLLEQGPGSLSSEFFPKIYRLDAIGQPEADAGPGPFLPIWQADPPLPIQRTNLNLLSFPKFASAAQLVIDAKQAVISEIFDEIPGESEVQPYSTIIFPIFDSFLLNRSVVAVLLMEIVWIDFFADLLPSSSDGMVIVVKNACGQSVSYQMVDENIKYLGWGDLHESKYDSLGETYEFDGNLMESQNNVTLNTDYCRYTVGVYPSTYSYHNYITRRPIIYCFIVVAVFAFTSLAFVAYANLVEKRQSKLSQKASRSNEIVSSLFPSNVLDRLLNNNETPPQQESTGFPQGGTKTVLDGTPSHAFLSGGTPKLQLQSFLNNVPQPEDDRDIDRLGSTKPIADLFPHATVLFADIAGFTAWSSTREPSQVFMLLESVYRSFDKLAKRLGVFKIETIGDCYMAVTGLPEPQEDHAVIMARFAQECIVRMKEVTRNLEVTLGPDTGDLCIRIGLHSGPVTAGVLRGEKSRFQLFGDTVNTASRMESTGERNRAQASAETAELLREAGKDHWIKQRDDKIFAKGKGELSSFWLTLKANDLPTQNSASITTSSDHNQLTVSCKKEVAESVPSTSGMKYGLSLLKRPLQTQKPAKPEQVEAGQMWGDTSLSVESNADETDKLGRLIDWNTDVLLQHVKAIVARRRLAKHRRGMAFSLPEPEGGKVGSDRTVLDEVTEIIPMPNFEPRVEAAITDPTKIKVNSKVTSQLRQFITLIASMYHENPFHNFEHASHVVLSANKLIQRIVTPHTVDYKRHSPTEQNSKMLIARDQYEYTFGITCDPLTHFAVLFSALIHDVDHAGVSNFQLILERHPIAAKYKEKSIAEQNSVDLAWAMLMDKQFDDLRKCICSTEDEAKRFRQLVINCVMATDIFDKELQNSRRQRWSKAFQLTHRTVPFKATEDANRKATIVIEHIIQASDVAHTMQHWQVYQKWNERLFNEMYTAWKGGRAGKNPSVGWYQGELSFFDNYVIPLAKKLKECGVFGVSGDEYLNYALENRQEWASKGEDMVQLMLATRQKEEVAPTSPGAKKLEGAACA